MRGRRGPAEPYPREDTIMSKKGGPMPKPSTTKPAPVNKPPGGTKMGGGKPAGGCRGR
jgi:hypothetical protein